MAVTPVAAGHSDLSSRKYIPELYASELRVEFYNSTVFSQIANHDQESKIKAYGDTVNIRTLPTIHVRNYQKNQDLDFDDPDPSYTSLLIDKAKYFAFKVELVDQRQSDIAYAQKWALHAAEQLKSGPDGIDRDVLSNIYGNANARNAGLTAGLDAGINLGVSGTPLAINKVNILDKILECGVIGDEWNWPDTGRWIVISPRMGALIKGSDLKDASMTGDSKSTLRTGRIGMIDRFEIFISNNLTRTSSGGQTAYECVFGHKAGLTFAMQISERKIVDNYKGFGDMLKMLVVYGYKVIKTDCIGHLHAYVG